MKNFRHFLAGLSAALSMAACGGAGMDNAAIPPVAGPPSAPPPPPPPTIATWDGRYVGFATMGNQEYFADALMTIDGGLRLFISGPHADTGAMPLTSLEDSAQLVGSYEVHGDQAIASGDLIIESCTTPRFAPLCNQSARAEVHFSGSPIEPAQIHVTANGVDDSWSLQLYQWPGDYQFPASLDSLARQYVETNARFASNGDTIVSVDPNGQLFFQSANSGCTGNGALTPHLDGAFGVYDVILTIENCSAPFSNVNGEFTGLATGGAGTAWDYDLLLRIWLSKPVGAPSQVAVTMLGSVM